MPSAASAKLEKKSSVEVPNNNNTPLRQVLVIVEHKIRNLEKRKVCKKAKKKDKNFTAQHKRKKNSRFYFTFFHSVNPFGKVFYYTKLFFNNHISR